MPEDRKTNINNLTIVWQGQIWSVINPRGVVIRRDTSKQIAYEFAKNNHEYLSEEFPAENYLDQYFIEFHDDLFPKPKRDSLQAQSIQTPESGRRKETCFELILMVILLVVIVFPAPIFGLSLVFGVSLPFSEFGQLLVDIFRNDLSIPILSASILLIPGAMLLLFRIQNPWLSRLLREPLTMGFGLLGVVGILIGIIFTGISIFVSDLDTVRILIITMLWATVNYFGYRIAYELYDQ